MVNFLKQIFIWWHKQTLGTFIYTLFRGKLVGFDEFGNKYYTNKSGKRWVIYKRTVESSKIPPEWHMWIHFLCKDRPPKNFIKYNWQQKYTENLTGTPKAYKPAGSLSYDSKKNNKKYKIWNA